MWDHVQIKFLELEKEQQLGAHKCKRGEDW